MMRKATKNVWAYIFPSVLFLFSLGCRTARTNKLPLKHNDMYSSLIQPIMERSCTSCHGKNKSEGGLRLNSKLAFEKGGKNAPLIIWGDAEKSLLFQRLLAEDEGDMMPPITEAEPLSEEEVEIIRGWINSHTKRDAFLEDNP